MISFVTRFSPVVLSLIVITTDAQAFAQGIVPGTGRRVTEVGDDFEDPNWHYIPNFPKSSRNIDKQLRAPTGTASNNSFYESNYRGAPDVVKRVPTPPGGLPGSTGAMMMSSVNTGIPGMISMKQQQDDFMMNVNRRLNGFIPVSWGPNVVVRVYLPPFDQWENRTGSSFGFRADMFTTTYETKRGGSFRRSRKIQKSEPYWPGFFIQFNSKDDPRFEEDSAIFLIRGDQNGREVPGPQATEPGWWTLGMSFTPDGKVHYYARKGVGNLTRADHITSQFPYGFRAERFQTIFFNIVSPDNGRTSSTEWIVDDPMLFYANH